MKRLWAMALGLSIVATVSAQVSRPLARLSNGEIITSQDVESYLASRPDLRQVARNAWGAEQAVGEMALTRVLMLEGQQRGIVRRNTQTEERFDNVYGMDVLRQQLPQCVKPADEKEARAYFDAHPKAFVTPTQVRVQRIMLPAKTQVAGQASMGQRKARTHGIRAAAEGIQNGQSRGVHAVARKVRRLCAAAAPHISLGNVRVSPQAGGVAGQVAPGFVTLHSRPVDRHTVRRCARGPCEMQDNRRICEL